LEIDSINNSNKSKEKLNLKIVDSFSLAKIQNNNDNNPQAEVKTIIALTIINNFSTNINNNDFKIIIGMYSPVILILNYNSENKKLSFHCEIKNACSIHKPGISTLDLIQFEAKIKSEIEEMEFALLDIDGNIPKASIESSGLTKKVNFLCTGGYDYKIKLYEFNEDNNPIFEYLGSLYNGADNILHKVKFEKVEKIVWGNGNEFYDKDKDENGLFLFVASDQKIINIYNIA